MIYSNIPAKLAERTGLRQSTISNIVNVLVEAGIVAETGSISMSLCRRFLYVFLPKVYGFSIACGNKSCNIKTNVRNYIVK